MTGPELKAARRRLGRTQAELGSHLGVTARTVGAMERGETGISRAVEMVMTAAVAEHNALVTAEAASAAEGD